MKLLVSVAEPLMLATITSTVVPGVPAGVAHVIVVSFTTTMLVAALPPTVTVFVPGLLFWKPLPVSVMVVPPSEVPAAGATAVRVGSGW